MGPRLGRVEVGRLEPGLAAVFASQPYEPMREDAASQVGAELLFDVVRELVVSRARARLRVMQHR